MAKVLDDVTLFEINERKERLRKRCEGNPLVDSDLALATVKDFETLINGFLDEKERTGRFRKKYGLAFLQRDLALESGLKKQRRMRCGLSCQNLFLIRHFIQQYPQMSLAECFQKGTGEEISAAEGRRRLHLAGWAIQYIQVRMLVPHKQSNLPEVPIPSTYQEAVDASDEYDLRRPVAKLKPEEVPPEDDDEGVEESEED